MQERNMVGKRFFFLFWVFRAQESQLFITMFGLRFNFSTGWCTRGAYIQILPLDNYSLKEEIVCDFVLINDTEGLHAP